MTCRKCATKSFRSDVTSTIVTVAYVLLLDYYTCRTSFDREEKVNISIELIKKYHVSNLTKAAPQMRK